MAETMKWENLEFAEGPSPRRWHTFSPLPERADQLLVYGGYDAPKHPLSDAFILDLGRGALFLHTWLRVADSILFFRGTAVDSTHHERRRSWRALPTHT